MPSSSPQFAVLLPPPVQNHFKKPVLPERTAPTNSSPTSPARSVLQRAVSLFTRRPDVPLIAIITSPAARYEEHLRHLNTLHATASPSSEAAASAGNPYSSACIPLPGPQQPAPIRRHRYAAPLTPLAVIDEAFYLPAMKRAATLPAIPEPATLKRRAPDGTVRPPSPDQPVPGLDPPMLRNFGIYILH